MENQYASLFEGYQNYFSVLEFNNKTANFKKISEIFAFKNKLSFKPKTILLFFF